VQQRPGHLSRPPLRWARPAAVLPTMPLLPTMPPAPPRPLPRLRMMLLAVLLAAPLAGCAGTDSVQAGPGGDDSRYVAGNGTTEVIEPARRRPAPQITGTTFDGAAYRLSDHRGKAVVINFWASWCAPCRAESPALQHVYQQHRSDGVEFLGVNIKDGRENAKAFLRNVKITYPSLYDQPGEVALGFRDTVPPNAIPSTIVIDRKGRVAARIIGPTTLSALRGLVSRIAAEPS
jgi:thiol-disulfide isomerase/thioredoxin